MASNVGAFLALPPQIFLVLFLVFLNSFQGFGIRFVRYQYLTNEYGFSDKAAASLLGVQATLNLFFAGVGAVLTDAVGVRRCAMVAMSVSIVGRALVAFGRSRLDGTRRRWRWASASPCRSTRAAPGRRGTSSSRRRR
jgi:nitrate/nitrite transporter NarK